MAGKRSDKRIPRYPLLLLLILLIGVLSSVVVMNQLYEALAVYESKTPGTAVNRYFERISAGDFSVIRAESGFEAKEYSPWEDFDAAVQKKFGGIGPEDLSFRRIASNEPDGRQVYAIYDGDEKRGEVRLYEGEGADGGWRVTTPLEFLPPYTVTAPACARIAVNGKILPPEDAEERQEDRFGLFAELPQDIKPPTVLTYRIEGFLSAPELTATAPEGAECAVAFDDEYTMYVTLIAAGELRETLAEIAGSAAETYAKYISGAESETKMVSYLLPDTDFYIRMRTFDHQWHYLYQLLSIESVSVKDMDYLSENCVTVGADLSSRVRRGADEFDYELSYIMSFVLQNDRWLLLDLNISR